MGCTLPPLASLVGDKASLVGDEGIRAPQSVVRHYRPGLMPLPVPGVRRWSAAYLVLLLALTSVVAACSPKAEPAPDTTTPVQSLAPEDLVSGLMAAVDEGRFEDAAALTDVSQAALLTLVEGADPSEVADLLAGDGRDVSANFWSGFAQTLPSGFSSSDLQISVGDTIEKGGVEFVRVTVEAPEGDPQVFVLHHDGRWEVDLMATFAPILAERMVPPVDNLLQSANPDAGTVLEQLRRSAPSLEVAIDNPDLPAEVRQSLLALIERVTRIG
jgi:hypothetical protein